MDWRPSKLDDFVGNNKIKDRLRISIEAAKIKHEPLPHILFQGNYGCGKTSLAKILKNEIGGNIYELNGPAITEHRNILECVIKLQHGDILFIDEIHRLEKKHEEFLYPIMEDFKVIQERPILNVNDIKLKQQKPFIEIKISPFTLIGATTDIGSMGGPFYSRFKCNFYLEPYSVEDLVEIGKINSIKLGLSISPNAIEELAKRSKKVPRVLNSRLDWINDYKIAKKLQQIDKQNVIDAMSICDVDEYGFELNDRKYLQLLANADGPKGIKSIAAAMGTSIETITQYVEPYLVNEGIVEVTQNGRVLKTRIKGMESGVDNMDNIINQVDI